MRHLLALLTLAFVLVACDDEATTAPADTIPGPPNAPYLKVTVLTGTKAAPVDSPTVKVEWKYKDSVMVLGVSNHNYDLGLKSLPVYGIGSSVIKTGCYGKDSISVLFVAVYQDKAGADSSLIYCK